MATYILGTGGHARALKRLHPKAVMVHEEIQGKLKALRNPRNKVFVGWLGQTPEALEARERKARSLLLKGINVHTDPQVMLGAILDPSVTLRQLCVVNQGAVVCHDCYVGLGTHIGPGAVLCGGVTVGDYCMIGAGAVVLPGTHIPQKTLVKAGTRWPK